MSELDDRLREEERRSAQRAIERLVKANHDFDVNLDEAVWPREKKRRPLWQHIVWALIVCIAGYACIWAVLAAF